MTHALRLLGSPQLDMEGRWLALERKTAAVLAYLAVEGETSKYKLAGWLWPDSGETAARNNMRQLLRRFRLSGADIIEGDDRISLSQRVITDVSNLSSLDLGKVLELKNNAELLEGFDYDDAADFAEWLGNVREEFAALRLRAAQTEAERLESRGHLGKALELAHLALKLEPFSEAAHRRVMRLHYLLGDRAAALAAFEKCKVVLAEELGAEPLPETLALRHVIERGTVLKGSKPKPKETRLPTAILRPPVLAGREQEWALMEEAWEAGKFIFLVGEPGVGKSRLATDFLTSKGGFISLETRPGDANIPYSANNRFVRNMLARYPDYKPPTWVRQTLAAWLPELGEAAPASDPGLHTRYFDAVANVFNQIGLHGETAFIDDLQFMDDISVQTGEYILSQLFPLHQPSGLQGIINCYRQGELSPVVEQIHIELVTRGMAIRLFLEPLTSEAVGTMLQGLGLPETKDLVPGLSRYTGGNPLFILETVKHLIETDTLALGLPSRLAPPGKVAPLVTRRLQRLSPQALNLARAAAIAGTSFEMRLAAFVLERPAMEIAEAHAELETTQILRGNAFTHDLIFEAVLASIPKAVAQVLNGRTALYLETTKANPALIAHHWLEAGDESKAAPWFLEAARKLYSGKEAASFYSRAAAIFERQGEADKAFESRVSQLKALRDEDVGENTEQLVEHLLAAAKTAAHRAQALIAKCDWLRLVGRYETLPEVMQNALSEARKSGDTSLEVQVLERVGSSLWTQGKIKETLELLEQARMKAKDSEQPDMILSVERMLFVVNQSSGDWGAAEPHYHAALQLAEQLGDYNTQAMLLTRAGLHFLNIGDAGATFKVAEKSWQVLEKYHGSVEFRHLTTLALWAAHHMLGSPLEGIRSLERVAKQFEGQNYSVTGVLYGAMALSFVYLGQLGKAEAAFEVAKNWPGYPPNALHLIHAGEALLVQHGRRAMPKNIELFEGVPPPELGRALLAWAATQPPKEALAMVERALELGTNRTLATVAVAAHTRKAQSLLALGKAKEALKAIEIALPQLQLYKPFVVDPTEVYFTYYQVLKTLGKPEAKEALAKAQAWMQSVVEKLPEDYRESFLKHNPVNRAVLGALTL